MPQPWPLASATDVLDVFRPLGGPSSDAPLRTLRRNGAMSHGIRVTSRNGAHFAGSQRVYSALNLDAARLARRGDAAGARAFAEAAAHLESRIIHLVDSLSTETITQHRAANSDHLSIFEIAEETRNAQLALPATPDVQRFAGTLASFQSANARVVTAAGQVFDLPRHLAINLGARLGDWVVITREDIGNSVLVRLEPAMQSAEEIREPDTELAPGMPDSDYLCLMQEGFDDPAIIVGIERVARAPKPRMPEVVNLVG